jgi:dolichyl-phosphate-mannose--protein O-mannosyl transferase
MQRRHLGIALILLIGAILRLWNLSSPEDLVFDEVYYVNGANDYLADAVETDSGKPEFIVHPPIGKWAIAAGISIFGDNPFGWRFSAALFGIFSILLIYLVALRLFDSQFMALLAAGLTVIDGLHLVMSRTALLDIFLMTFLLAAFLALLHQRYLLTAICFGLALGTKWSAIYFIAAVFIYLLITKRKALISFVSVIPIIYLLSWSGWFLSDKGWSRDSSSNSFIALFNYHREILNFHTGLTTDHSYEASPWNWLLLGRPTSFFYEAPKDCGAASCSQEILAMGTPVIWWGGLIAITVTIGYFIYRREQSAGLILLALLSNYLPWFLFPERTTFYFYAIAFQPYLILTICYVASIFMEPVELREKRRQIVVSGVAVAGLCFLYFLPVYIGLVTTYDQWFARMWLPSWI